MCCFKKYKEWKRSLKFLKTPPLFPKFSEPKNNNSILSHTSHYNASDRRNPNFVSQKATVRIHTSCTRFPGRIVTAR